MMPRLTRACRSLPRRGARFRAVLPVENLRRCGRRGHVAGGALDPPEHAPRPKTTKARSNGSEPARGARRAETIGNGLNLTALRADLQKMAPPLRVVVADDDDVLRDLLVLNLEAEGLVVYEAADGAKALQLIAEERPDLVVLDVMMPKFDGLAALRALKGEPLTTNIPIVLLTARAGEDEIQEGWAAGADYYLTKPFRVEELLDLVNELRPAAQLHAEQR